MKKNTKKSKIKDALIAHTDPKAIVSEAFRNMRTNVHYSNVDKELKVIQVTSSQQGEGKSTITANYATTLAQSGKKVLIIDCDLRRPNIHKVFGMPNAIGLINVLMRESELDRSIKYTKVEGVFVLVAGPVPPNPSEMLESKRMDEIINVARENFDIILLDSPPVLPVTDALIISKYTEGTIVVIALEETQKEALKKTVESLENIGANIIGTVVNKANIKKGHYGYGGYSYKYAYKE